MDDPDEAQDIASFIRDMRKMFMDFFREMHHELQGMNKKLDSIVEKTDQIRNNSTLIEAKMGSIGFGIGEFEDPRRDTYESDSHGEVISGVESDDSSDYDSEEGFKDDFIDDDLGVAHKPVLILGEQVAIEVARHPDSVSVVTEIIGYAGLKPTVAAIETVHTIMVPIERVKRLLQSNVAILGGFHRRFKADVVIVVYLHRGSSDFQEDRSCYKLREEDEGGGEEETANYCLGFFKGSLYGILISPLALENYTSSNLIDEINKITRTLWARCLKGEDVVTVLRKRRAEKKKE